VAIAFRGEVDKGARSTQYRKHHPLAALTPLASLILLMPRKKMVVPDGDARLNVAQHDADLALSNRWRPLMFRHVLLPALAMASVAFAERAQTAIAPTTDLAPGQEWSIKSASPTTAKVIIGRVEPWRDNIAVSVSIVDLPIPQGDVGAGGVTQIPHIPFEKSALAASLDQLLATDVPPAPIFESGYKQWHDAKGGIFTISVEKAIVIMFQTINRRQG
jgi:hypothetical protein